MDHMDLYFAKNVTNMHKQMQLGNCKSLTM